MSWLFSRVLVAEYSEESSLDGGQSAPSNGTPTPQAYLWPGRTTDAWSRFPSGMTCLPLTVSRGEALLMSYRAGFLARTSVQPEKAQDLPENAADCGGKWPESLAKYDPATSSWKTAHCLLSEDCPPSLATLPRWGMMRDGELLELAPLVRPTKGNESGWWPTPCANEDSYRLKGNTQQSRSLGAMMRREAIQRGIGGQLSPMWTEWLMGFPVGWTGLEPLETHKYQQWLKLHGKR